MKNKIKHIILFSASIYHFRDMNQAALAHMIYANVAR